MKKLTKEQEQEIFNFALQVSTHLLGDKKKKIEPSFADTTISHVNGETTMKVILANDCPIALRSARYAKTIEINPVLLAKEGKQMILFICIWGMVRVHDNDVDSEGTLEMHLEADKDAISLLKANYKDFDAPSLLTELTAYFAKYPTQLNQERLKQFAKILKKK